MSISRNYIWFLELINNFKTKKYDVQSGLIKISGINLMDMVGGNMSFFVILCIVCIYKWPKPDHNN